MSRSVPSFPPAGDAEARYDAVVRRGSQLRRRHKLRVAAGTGGTVAAAVLALVLFMGGSDDSQPQELLGSTTTTTTASPTDLSVEMGTRSGGGTGTRAVAVTVRDPLQPAGPGSQVCVHLQVSTPGGTAGGVAAGSSCWAAGQPDGPPVDLVPSDAVIGCAAVMGQEPFPTTGVTQPVLHTFTFTAPESVVPDGLHNVEATVVSGVGDGCPPRSDGENERIDTKDQTLQFP